MKGFSEHSLLTEKEKLAWQESASAMVLGKDSSTRDVVIPMSAPILRRVFGEPVRTTVFHVSGVHSLDDMLKGQKKSRSISAFTVMHPSWIAKGVQTNGGACYELEANVLIHSPDDIVSAPDKTGRRWVEMRNISQMYDITDVGGFDKLQRDVGDALESMVETFGPEVEWYDDPQPPIPVKEAAVGKLKRPVRLAPGLAAKRKGRRTFRQSWIRWKTVRKLIVDSEDGKLMGRAIGAYIDAMEAAIAKNMKSFREVFRTAALRDDKYGIVASQRGWNELLVNQYVVKRVMLHRPRIINATRYTTRVKHGGSLNLKGKVTQEIENKVSGMSGDEVVTFWKKKVMGLARIKKHNIVLYNDAKGMADYISGVNKKLGREGK